MTLRWHPRHPDRQRPSRREDAVVYADPAEPVYVDEALISREEAAEFAERFKVEPCDLERVERQFADSEELLSEAADEALGIEPTDRLPFSPRSGPRLSAEASRRVGARLAQERAEGEALRRAGLLPEELTR